MLKMKNMKLTLTLEGDIQRLLDILGLLITEDYQDYIINLETSNNKDQVKEKTTI